MVQDLNGTLTHTIQSQVNSDLIDNSLSILPFLLQAGELIPPYWSKTRDEKLSRFWMREDHISSALSMFVSKTASIPVKVVPRDMSIKAHVKQADDLTANLNELSDWGKGWASSFAIKMIMSFVTQDNGCFAEILGDGKPDKERRGFYGVAALDPGLCQRTSNPLYPIVYWDIGIGGTGNRYKMHHTRVMEASSLPNYLRPMNNVGFSAMSRMINTAQHLLDMSTTEQEELGSRPKRRLIIGKKGITGPEIVTAFLAADRQMDNEGLTRFSKNVVIGPTTKATANNEIDIEVLDLASVLKGEDKERSITLGMFLIALSLNIPPRWIWPATSTGATKADAMFQHIAGMGGGIGHLLQVFINMLGGSKLADTLGKPVPSHLEVVFDNQDDEQDRQQAEIREVRAKTRKENLASKVMDIRTARERMLDAGDISEQQFDDMELADGRLPDGQDILNLFLTTDPTLQEMLSISVGDVLNVKENDAETVLSAIEDKLLEVRAILVNPIRPKIFDQAKQAFGALIALKALYEDSKVQAQIEEGMGQGEPELDEDGQPVKIVSTDDNITEATPESMEETKESSWMQKLVNAGAIKDDILDIVIDTQTDTYHINIGDWAEDKTRQVIRKVFAGKKFVIDDEAAYPDKKRYTQPKESMWLTIVDKLLPIRKEQAPVVNVTMPAVHVTTPEHTFNITMPEQQAAEVKAVINMPKPEPVHVENIVNLPKQAAPVFNVKSPDIHLPDTTKEMPAPVFNVYPQMPEQPAPIVTVYPQNTINVNTPEVVEEVVQVERDTNGFIKLARKFKQYAKGTK